MNYFHRIILKSQRLRDLRRPGRSRLILENHGQAMIEYLLMLVVIVILILGLTMAVFKPLSTFITQLNKTYIQCLLETGELPRVGTDTEAVCDAEIPKFQTNNLDGSAVDPDNPKGANQNENQRGESSSADGSTGNEASSGGGGGSTAGNRKSSMIRSAMRSKGKARPELGAGKTTNIPVDEFNAGEGFASNSMGAISVSGKRRTKKMDLSGLTEFDRKKVEREQQKSRTIATDSESFTQNRNKKLLVKPPPEKKLEDDQNINMDFSGYFKIFFLIIIILFIIILAGSQAMQMTNNSDN